MYKSFLDMEPPPGYVAGVGRGATSFTTRSDIGPAAKGNGDGEDLQSDRFQDAEENSLFKAQKVDAADEEADRIFEQVDARMKERRKVQRDERAREEINQLKKDNEEIKDQFKSEKRELAKLTMDDWAAIPEAGDITRRNKRRRIQEQANRRTYATPDALIAQRQAQGLTENAIDPNDEGDSKTDFKAISSAKEQHLTTELDKRARSSTNVDAQSYLSGLEAGKKNVQDVEDTEKARLLFKSLIKAQPHDSHGYIGLARLEEQARKIGRARELLEQGSLKCRKSEELWLERLRINERENARVIANHAIHHLPGSIALWLKAAELEESVQGKMSVLQRALAEEQNESTEVLWKQLIELYDDPTEVRILLQGAVQKAKKSEALWLALARLEEPKAARKVLSRARVELRGSRAVWLAASKLEESNGKGEDAIDKILERAVNELQQQLGEEFPERQIWIQDAKESEDEGCLLTCRAIIKSTIGYNVDESEQLATWIDDAKPLALSGHIETARAVYAHAMRVAPHERNLYITLLKFEKSHGSSDIFIETAAKAVSLFPNDEEIWLSYVQEWRARGNLDETRKVLHQAFDSNPKSVKLWLAAADIEIEGGQPNRAQEILNVAKSECNDPQVWVKSAILMRELGSNEEALESANEGLLKFKDSAALYLEKGMLYEIMEDRAAARHVYGEGVKACPENILLWLRLARLEQQRGLAIRARSVLDSAALIHKSEELVWHQRVQLELSVQNQKQAEILVSQGLQHCPKSGILWSDKIWMQPRIKRRQFLAEALATIPDDPALMTTAARAFWDSNKKEKAPVCFAKALELDSDYADAYLWYYKYLVEERKEEPSKELKDKFLEQNPQKGLLWKAVTDDAQHLGKTNQELFDVAVASL